MSTQQSDYEFYELLTQMQDSPTSVFRILPRTPDRERAHTRVLNWLFNPHESHGAGEAFLDAFLNLTSVRMAGKDVTNREIFVNQNVEGVETVRKGREKVELDLLLESPDTLLGVELKTSGGEDPGKFTDEFRGLQARAAEKADQDVHLVHAAPTVRSGFRQAIAGHSVESEKVSYVSWSELLNAIRAHADKITDPYASAILTDFINTVESTITTQVNQFTPGALIRMLYPDEAVRAGVQAEANAAWQDLEAYIFNRLESWFTDNYSNPWTTTQRSGYLVMYREGGAWEGDGFYQNYTPVSIQVLTRGGRIERGSYEQQESEPFVEVTLTIEHRKSNRDRRREEVFKRLDDGELPGYDRINYAENSNLSAYHALRKQIPILDHESIDSLVGDIQQSVKQLALRESLITEATRTADMDAT